MNTDLIKQVFTSGLGTVFTAAAIEIRQNNQSVQSATCGWLDPGKQRPVAGDTLFDLASISKLFLTTAFMTLVEQGKVGLDQRVCSVLPVFNGLRQIAPYEHPLRPGEMVPTDYPGQRVDASQVTFRNLLAHNSGLPAWHALFRAPNAEAARQQALASTFFYPTGAQVVYSDIGLIVLGLAVERLTGQRLDEALYERVTRPAGLESPHYLPMDRPNLFMTRVVPSEFCAWRRRRLVGEVDDENAARLGGVAGHAGLFSTAADLARFGQIFLQGGAPLLLPETVAEMTRQQSEQGFTRRGLGFALWSPDPEASSNPLSPQTFGHTGFTGTSLWIDPQRRLVVALLTNRVYYGRDAAAISAYRVKFHRAVVEACEP